MNIRPPRRTSDLRRQPSSGAGAVERVVVPAAERPAATPAQAGSEQSIEDLLREFEGILYGDTSIDPELREHLQKQFVQALDEATANPQQPLGALPDRATWLDAIEMLRQSGAVEEGEVNDLVRQIDQALEPLQRRESQLAIEFSRRLNTDGEEEALAWFRQERIRASAEPSEIHDGSPVPGDGVPPQLRSDMVNARAHRLRGPPRKR